ncbi:MAG: alpha/beta hydrolase fold domain-containing protein [Brucellaceae bacterium]|nr:alpha/beta hydrolase fold domain-containing protein [Brucellaceae bacterium]
MGDSAGANLAAAVSIALRGTAHAPIAQLLVYLRALRDVVSRLCGERRCTAAPDKGMPGVNAMYCPDEEERKNPSSRRSMPTITRNTQNCIVAGHDPLRDDWLRLCHDRLRAASVPVDFDAERGPHPATPRAMEYCAASRSLDRMCGGWLRTIPASGKTR